MLFSIPLLMAPSAPITMRIASVFIFHILCISISRSLNLLFFSTSLLESFCHTVHSCLLACKLNLLKEPTVAQNNRRALSSRAKM